MLSVSTLDFARSRASLLWHDYPRETLALALLLASLSSLGGAAWSTPSFEGTTGNETRRAEPPKAPPLLVQQIDPTDALSLNAAIPISAGANPAAQPFLLGKAGPEARARAAECLASAVYYEAGNESLDGQRAVAQVVLNRVRHPAFPASVCGVVFEGATRTTGCQFTFTCDGSLARRADAAGWSRAWHVAQAALGGHVHAPIGWATHYHADYVVPYWASSLAKNAIVGRHIFYRWSGGWGRPTAFSQRYSRREGDVAALRTAALSVERSGQPAEFGEAPIQTIAEIPGAEALPLTPSMRGDKKVAVRFNLAARKASDAVQPTAYVDRNGASDALRWALGGGTAGDLQAALGKTASAAPDGSARAPAAISADR